MALIISDLAATQKVFRGVRAAVLSTRSFPSTTPFAGGWSFGAQAIVHEHPTAARHAGRSAKPPRSSPRRGPDSLYRLGKTQNQRDLMQRDS